MHEVEVGVHTMWYVCLAALGCQLQAAYSATYCGLLSGITFSTTGGIEPVSEKLDVLCPGETLRWVH